MKKENKKMNIFLKCWKWLSFLAIFYTVIFVFDIVYSIISTGEIINSITDSLLMKHWVVIIISLLFFGKAFFDWKNDDEYYDSIIIGMLNLIVFLILRKYYLIFYWTVVVLKVLNKWFRII